MNEPAHDKKPRHVRIERSSHLEIQDETSHLWAVSYADLLMVLLSFFVIFFSVDKDKRSSVIQSIGHVLPLSEMQNTGSADMASKSPVSAGWNLSLRETFKNSELAKYIVTTQDNDSILLELPDNAFAPGKFELRPDAREQLSELFQRLKPFEDQIDITVIGHADTTPVTANRHEFMDNLELSSRRASRSATLFKGLGWPGRIDALGSGESRRNSRTLSLLVQSRKVGT